MKRITEDPYCSYGVKDYSENSENNNSHTILSCLHNSFVSGAAEITTGNVALQTKEWDGRKGDGELEIKVERICIKPNGKHDFISFLFSDTV